MYKRKETNNGIGAQIKMKFKTVNDVKRVKRNEKKGREEQNSISKRRFWCFGSLHAVGTYFLLFVLEWLECAVKGKWTNKTKTKLFNFFKRIRKTSKTGKTENEREKQEKKKWNILSQHKRKTIRYFVSFFFFLLIQ